MRLLPIAVLLVVVACGRGVGPDSDGDGLSDRQEARFGTDPRDPDSDDDGIPDGSDDEPLGQGPTLTLTRGPVRPDGETIRCADLTARLSNGRGEPIAGRPVEFFTDWGTLAAPVEVTPGTWQGRVCTAERVTAHVSARYDDPYDAFLPVEASVAVAFTVEGDLPQPGVNTGRYSGAGPLAGTLRVFALDADTVGFPGSAPAPFEGAQVVVRTDAKPLVGFTSPDGFVEFEDEALQGPVDVTVGADGYRFISYLGVDAANVAVPMVPLDPVPGRDDARVGDIEGSVTGFFGEARSAGIEAFPNTGSLLGCDEGTRLPLAILQVALHNVPLSSISMGNILEAPDPAIVGPFPIPSNLVVPTPGDPASWRFALRDVPEGQHLLFALGGTTRCLLEAMKDPYHLWFEPWALAVERVQVRGGEVTTQDLLFSVDLRPRPGTTVDVSLGGFPADWKTGEPLPNGLVFAVVDTGGEGYLFVAVDASYQWTPFHNPIRVRYPNLDHPAWKALGVTPTYLAVGFAGRGAALGADPAGMTTAITPGVAAGDPADYSAAPAWLPVPHIRHPEPPSGVGGPLDAVSPDPFAGEAAWEPVSWPRQPDFHVFRVNYLTPAPRNTLIETPEDPRKGSVGGPASHCLWEIFVPGDRSAASLAEFPSDAPLRPALVNPVPTDDDLEAPQHYGPRTLELELNAYLLGAGGKPFDYNNNFEYFDVNLHAAGVSQDSVVVEMP